MQKPIIFLDFDRTLFDTEQFYDWLGDSVDSRIRDLVLGTITPPDFASMLYPDTLSFLQRTQGTHRLVLLTHIANPALQEKKIHESGISPYMDDVLIVTGEHADIAKGRAAKEYLSKSSDLITGHIFVDDNPENISQMKALNPSMTCVRIDRLKPLADALVLTPNAPDAVVTNLAELLLLL